MHPVEMAHQYQYAQQLYAEGRFQEALDILDRLDRQAPNHPEISNGRALCLHAVGRSQEALVLCNKLYMLFRDQRGVTLRKRIETDLREKNQPSS